jgi:uncharacterized protein (DUF427 family)
MTDKPIRQPGPDHPIRIERNPARITVAVAGQVFADTRNALTQWEANYPPVQYIPLSDVDTRLLQWTDHYTYCPFKGDCSYYTVLVDGPRTVKRGLDLRRALRSSGGHQGPPGVLPRIASRSPKRSRPPGQGPAARQARPRRAGLRRPPGALHQALRSARVCSARRASSVSGG